ncbi:MAG TPA: hypothetical protein VH374_02120 [Polyangia bacterium]|jgi:hypothetical protein|nr:hypothetical protein [Polyangia bacterium]
MYLHVQDETGQQITIFSRFGEEKWRALCGEARKSGVALALTANASACGRLPS